LSSPANGRHDPAHPGDGPVLLAAYGTLMTGRINPLTPSARARMRSLGPCLLDGRLYEIRDSSFAYPALVLSPAPGGTPVQAELFAIGESEAEARPVLAETDAYENFCPGRPDRSTYLRVQVPVRYPDRPGCDRAWVYVYNRPVKGAAPLPEGRWQARDEP
jgi:gamma-glutamylcyclotransferase (GGCT)/AIG2-like uncharacterized protein YtfP